ncbi:MAG: hypothetical protein ACREPP_04420 [Rhodanobacteraceae bacterium]
MKGSILLAICVFASQGAGAATQPGIRFDTVVMTSGKVTSHPSVWVNYGKPAVIEIPGAVRIVAVADAPHGDTSHVTAKMYYFRNGTWVLDWSPGMDANIAETPSFERDMGDGVHRVVLMPRRANKPTG